MVSEERADWSILASLSLRTLLCGAHRRLSLQLEYQIIQVVPRYIQTFSVRCGVDFCHRVDSDSLLMDDIKKLKETEGQDHVLLHVMFDDKFPYSPPFIRVVKPVLSGGYVLAGGAICMELLTPQVRRERFW